MRDREGKKESERKRRDERKRVERKRKRKKEMRESPSSHFNVHYGRVVKIVRKVFNGNKRCFIHGESPP